MYYRTVYHYRQKNLSLYTVPNEIDFSRYNMECSGENLTLRGIVHVVSCFLLHFMLYRRNFGHCTTIYCTAFLQDRLRGTTQRLSKSMRPNWPAIQISTDSGKTIISNSRGTLSWVQQYQKFEIEHFTGRGEAILPQKLGIKQKKFCLHKWLANLHGFANFCKLSVAQTFKVMQYKICFKVVFHKHLKFCFYKFAKKLIFTVLLVVQISIFCKLCKKC